MGEKTQMMNLDNITNSHIKAVLDSCSERVRKIIIDRFVKRLSHKEIFPQYDITVEQVASIISNYIFSERDRRILCDHFINGYTYEEIAERHELSTVQVKRIVYKNEVTVFKHL